MLVVADAGAGAFVREGAAAVLCDLCVLMKVHSHPCQSWGLTQSAAADQSLHLKFTRVCMCTCLCMCVCTANACKKQVQAVKSMIYACLIVSTPKKVICGPGIGLMVAMVGASVRLPVGVIAVMVVITSILPMMMPLLVLFGLLVMLLVILLKVIVSP